MRVNDSDALCKYLGIILAFLICFCVSFRPIGSGMTLGLGSNLIIHIIIFFCGILWVVRAAVGDRITYRSGKIAAAAAVFILMCIVWTVVAPRKLPALLTLISWTSDIVLLLVVIQSADDGTRRTVLTCLMASAVVAACMGIAQYLWGLDELRRIIAANPERVKRNLGISEEAWGAFMGRVNTDRVFGTLVYPNALAGFLDIVLPIAIGLCLGAALSLRRPVSPEQVLRSGFVSSVTVAAVISICLLLTFSKGGWVAAAAACFFLFVGLSGFSRKWILITAGICVGAVVLVVAGGGLWHMPKLSQYGSSLKVRLEYWEAGLRMMRDRYFVGGVGLRNFGDYYTAYKKPSYQEVKLAHSTIVQLLADMGILGLASYAALWVFLLRGVLKGGSAFMKGGFRGICRIQPRKIPPSPPSSKGGALKEAPFGKRLSHRWVGLAGGVVAFVLLAVARDISPFTKEMGVIDYSEWFRYMVLWILSFLVIERLVLLSRPVVRLGLAAGCVGYLVHGMVDFDMFVPGVHQAALLAAACGCTLPVKERHIANSTKAFLFAASLAAAAVMMLWMHNLLPIPDLLTGETLKGSGQALILKGKVDEGVVSLRKSADANPLDEEVHVILSSTYWRMWKDGRKTFRGEDTRRLALEAARSAAQTNPRSSARRAQLARILAVSDLEGAVNHAREAVRLYPARPQGHVLLGKLLMKAGRDAEALGEYREALRLNELVMESWLKISQEDMKNLGTLPYFPEGK